jgi:uncharacterized protein YndB with AHSA1/START domain
MPPRKNKTKRQPANRVLELTRIFSAPRLLVFDAWTKPEHISQWSTPRGITLPFSEAEVRPGGRWRSCMRLADGTDLWLSGEYRQIVPGELIEFTHAWEENGVRAHETVVTVRLSDYGKKTKLSLRQAFFDSVASRDGHRGGWSECFEKLAGFLSTKKSTPGKRTQK